MFQIWTFYGLHKGNGIKVRNMAEIIVQPRTREVLELCQGQTLHPYQEESVWITALRSRLTPIMNVTVAASPVTPY